MATYQVVYWKEIPSQVDAREASVRHQEVLSRRFQELIEVVAAKRKLDSANDYIKAWTRGEKCTRAGPAKAVAQAVAAEFETRFDAIRAKALAQTADA
jgi:Tfp pilus assembly major pilin PilA